MSDALLSPTHPPLDARDRPLPALPAGAAPWMADAFALAPETSAVEADGARLEVLQWGPRSGPGVLLVHGQGAHADWWRFIAPLLVAAGRRVVALSLSGMGGSDWRESYGVPRFARDLAAVAHATGLLDAPGSIFVGHSFGCLPLLAFARERGDMLGALYLIDFYMPPVDGPRRLPPIRKLRRYASFVEGLARFRLSPEQFYVNPPLVDYVGRRGVRRMKEPDGTFWTWCADPRAVEAVDHRITEANLAAVPCPLAILRGERSRLVDRTVAERQRQIAPTGTRYIEIPDADHHVLLDQPLALVAAIRALITVDRPEPPDR